MTAGNASLGTPDTIVLIHGLWLTGRSWEHWAERYESRGYKVLAPSWPGMEVEVEALNRDPGAIGELHIDEIVDHYEEIIRGLESRPIIMGHSFGGTFTQLLVDRGLGAAGVGIASGTVKGVPDLPLSTIRATSPVLRNPFNRGKAIPLDAKQFHYGFTNTMEREESDNIYERYHVPAASTVLFEGASPTCTGTRRPRSTSRRTIERPCSSSPSRTITSSRRRRPSTTPRSTPRQAVRQSRPTGSSLAGRTSPGPQAGKRSPTTHSTGRSPPRNRRRDVRQGLGLAEATD